MKYVLLLFFILTISQNANANNFQSYKDKISDKYNLNFGLNATLTHYNTSKNNITKEIYSPYLNKTILNNKQHKGTLNFSLNVVRFSPQTPLNTASSLGIANLFDSYDTNYNELYELYYAHTLKLKNTIELGFGQIPISKFDTQTRSPLQIQHFNNNSLCQNGSFTYPTSGLGTYVSVDNNKDFSVSIGSIDATNPFAQGIHTKNLDKLKFSSFINLNYYPLLRNKYQSSYSILIYDKPNVAKAPTSSRGISISLLQDISTNKSVFFKYNTSNGDYSIIKNSYSFGYIQRTSPNSSLGVGYSINKINSSNAIHKHEEVLEAYYEYNLNPTISITPDVEIYKKPAFNSSQETIFSLTLKIGI